MHTARRVTQGHRQCHHLIDRIRISISFRDIFKTFKEIGIVALPSELSKKLQHFLAPRVNYRVDLYRV